MKHSESWKGLDSAFCPSQRLRLHTCGTPPGGPRVVGSAAEKELVTVQNAVSVRSDRRTRAANCARRSQAAGMRGERQRNALVTPSRDRRQRAASSRRRGHRVLCGWRVQHRPGDGQSNRGLPARQIVIRMIAAASTQPSLFLAGDMNSTAALDQRHSHIGNTVEGNIPEHDSEAAMSAFNSGWAPG